MTDSKKLVLTAVAAVVVSVAACSLLCCRCNKVAVVDVQRVVASSKEVADFRQAQEDKAATLQEWVNKSNEEIAKLTSKEEKEALAEQYREELAQKQLTYQEEDVARLQEIDAQITRLIEKVAKDAGYNKAFVKSNVIFGGTDITDEVIDALKE